MAQHNLISIPNSETSWITISLAIQSYRHHCRMIGLIHKHPDIIQRELAKHAGISLGSMHCCLKVLAQKGWLKVGNFKNNPDKSMYLCLLTPEGISKKSKLAIDFLRRKKHEYDELKKEIEHLTEELHG
jgi:EPS-associated MarR family transcriptional regulator